MIGYLRHLARLTYRGLVARWALSGLRNREPSLAAAIIGAISGRASRPEQAWIDRIECLRRELSRSSEPLQIVDYGAGAEQDKRSQEEMYQGSQLSRSVGEVCSATSKSGRQALLLFRIIRELKPRVCVELGTSLGISACYQACALNLNGGGCLITMEGSEAVADIAARNFSTLSLDNIEMVSGRFQDNLPRVLSAHPNVDYAFIDGHHDQAATIRYFEAFLPALTDGATVVFDDIQWSEGMQAAWQTVCRNPRVQAAVNLGSMGVVRVGTARASTPKVFTARF